MTERHQEIARFIQRSRALRPLTVSPYTVPPPWREPYPDAQRLAELLLDEANFQALRLATWLSSPDGQLIGEAVALVISPALQPDFNLAVEALQLAAQMQYEQGELRRLAGVFAVIVVAAFGYKALAPQIGPAA